MDLPVDLPGNELVTDGIADLAAGRQTEASLLVSMAAPRLEALGYEVPEDQPGHEESSHLLYEYISDRDPDAHSRYNALVARMVSFARAAEHASAR